MAESNTFRFSLFNLMLAVLVLSIALAAANWGIGKQSNLFAVGCYSVGIPAAIGSLIGGVDRLAAGFCIGVLLMFFILPLAAVLGV
jgi:hypothetical protein